MRSIQSDTDDPAADRERRLRLSTVFWTYRTAIVVALVLVLALGLWASYGAYADPATTTDERLEHSWSATGDLQHEAPVVDSTAAYPETDVLEDEPIYYTAVSPTVEGTFVGGYDAERGEDVTVSLGVDAQYRAVDRDDEMVYWSGQEQLANVTESDVEPGEPVPVTFELNVSAVGEQIDEIEDDLEASPGETELFLEVDREIEGTIDGSPRVGSDTVRVPLEYDGDSYQFPEETSYEESFEEHETETVAVPAGPTRTVGGPLLAVLGIVGLAGAGVASRALQPPTPADREWLAYRRERAEFEAVIVPAILPESTLEGSEATVDSLDTLAEFGIDVGEAVVYDRRTDRYVVEHGDVIYVYEPPSLDEEPLDADGAAADAPLELSLPDPSDASEGDSSTDADGRNESESAFLGEAAADGTAADGTAADGTAAERASHDGDDATDRDESADHPVVDSSATETD